MGRKKTVDTETLNTVILKYKFEILKKEGNLALKSDKVWKIISREIGGILTPLAIYTIVKKNRYNVWKLLEYMQDAGKEENLIISDRESNSSETSSNNIEPYVKFEDVLSFEEFSSMLKKKTYNCFETSRKYKVRTYLTLKKGWTHRINDMVMHHTTFQCTLAFKRIKIYPEGTNYARIEGNCKDCRSILIGTISEQPVQGRDVIISFYYSGNFLKPHSSEAKRALSNTKREEAVINMLKTNVAPSAYRSMKAHEIEATKTNELNAIPSSNVLRVAKHEFLRRNRLHKDPILALGIMKRTVPYEGIIRDIGYDSFFVHYWSPAQINVFNEYCKRTTESVIAIDATGSVCHKINKPGNKAPNIFLYEITVPDKEAGNQYSICNMLSEKHDANSIHYWMKEWQRSGALKPAIVVCDMSLALLSASVKTFTQYPTLNDYLSACYKILFLKDHNKLPNTFIRCDVAHFMNLVSRWGSLRGQIKRNREFYLRVIAQIVQADTLRLLKKILYSTVTVALSETEGINEHERPVASETCKFFLKNLIGGEVVHTENMNKLLEEIEAEIAQNRKGTFSEWVKEIVIGCKNKVKNDLGDRGNQQYLPQIIDDILKVSKFIPLWSAIMVPYFKKGRKTATSTCVESSFNNLKNRIFTANELPARVDDFVSKHIKAIDGSLKLKSFCSTKKSLPGNISETQEIEVDNIDVTKKRNLDCAACSMGFQPTDCNCIICQAPIHRLPECSDPLEGDDEGYGQKRKCKSCSKKSSKEDFMESTAVENWKGLGRPTEKHKRSTYLTPKREWIDADLSVIKSVKSVGHLRNGSLLKPLILENELYMLTNTCAFDSIATLFCATYIDSFHVKNMILSGKAEFFQFIKELASNGVTAEIYKKRVQILRPLFPCEDLKSNLKRLSVHSASSVMLKKLLSSNCSYSQIFTSVCSEADCSMRKKMCNETCISITIDRTSDFVNLKQKIMEELKECSSLCQIPKEESIKNFPKSSSVDNNLKCKGIRKITKTINMVNFFLEIVSSAEEFTKDARVFLCNIPKYLCINSKNYNLRGIISYKGPDRPDTPEEIGHYICYCKRQNGDWELYDDLKYNSVLKSEKTKVRPHLIYYSL